MSSHSGLASFVTFILLVEAEVINDAKLLFGVTMSDAEGRGLQPDYLR